MKDFTSGMEVIHKDVVIIGNGPSGISLSVMLSGLVPYLKSYDHPDEMLSARLHYANPDHNLIRHQKLLEELAIGLEGRTTNPISLLLDALEHPCADLGLEIPSLIEWRRDPDHQIDHVVLGKGPPGGSWHTMDPNVLTLSLGSWMSLPGLPYTADDSTDSQRRASAGSVARYYENYVKEMHLEQFFKTGVNIISVERINNPTVPTPPTAPIVPTVPTVSTIKKVDTIIQKKDLEERRKCSFVSALNFIRSRTKCHKQQQKKELFQICAVPRTCKRPRDHHRHGEQLSPNRKIRELLDRKYLSEDLFYCDEQTLLPTIQSATTINRSKLRSLSFSCDSDFEKTKTNCDSNQKHNSLLNINECEQHLQQPEQQMEVLCECSMEPTIQEQNKKIPQNARWLITCYDNTTGKQIYYSCANLVLANGASDLPNRLGLPAETYDLPWVLHSLRSLETKLDQFVGSTTGTTTQPDPVLIIGAGLSAADAVIATRFRNIPVIHVFRNRSVSLDKQLPENFYPEYHKVHQMMLDGGSTYPLYTALPEYSVSDINASNKTVTLVSKHGIHHEYKVSFVVILIGSRPNLNFLPASYSLGVNKSQPVDAKQNPIDINTVSHSVNGYDGLYAIGPLAGDHFVRFIPGGALAVVSALNQTH